MTLLKALLLAATLAPLHAAPLFAQIQSPVETLDQSLFNSEPVEEIDISPQKTAPAAPIAVTTASAAPEKLPPVEYDTALLQGLKKVTAETSSFAAPINTPITFGTLVITVKKCVGAAEGERPENTALMLIQDNKPGEPSATVFSGWMFSSSPAISALEHPVYDITMLECVARKKK